MLAIAALHGACSVGADFDGEPAASDTVVAVRSLTTWRSAPTVRGVRAAPMSRVASVMRHGSPEVFWVATDGVLHDSALRGGEWQDEGVSGLRTTVPWGGVAAVVRRPDPVRDPGREVVHLFWIGDQGAVMHAIRRDGWRDWERQALTPPLRAARTTHLAAASATATSLDVLWVAPDGSVQHLAGYEDPNDPVDGFSWLSASAIAPAASAASYGRITALSGAPSHMDVFWVAPDGSIIEAFRTGTRWGQAVLRPAGAASTRSAIAAVPRADGNLQVFWISPAGSVESAVWDGDTWVGRRIAEPGNASMSGAVTAVVHPSDTVDALWIDPGNAVQGATWDRGRWSRYDVCAPDCAAAASGISAVAGPAGAIDVWWIAGHRTLHGTRPVEHAWRP